MSLDIVWVGADETNPKARIDCLVVGISRYTTRTNTHSFSDTRNRGFSRRSYCVGVTLILLNKRRRRLRAGRATRHYPDITSLPDHHSNKPRSLSGYEERRPPPTHDSASSVSSPSGAVEPLDHAPQHFPHQPHASSSHYSPRHHHRTASNYRSSLDPPDHPPPPPGSAPHYKSGQSSSSGVRSQIPPLSPSQSHSTATPVPYDPPQTNVPQMTSEPSVPHGHADGAVVDVALDNNNLVSASPSAIFGNTNSSDAGERVVNRQSLGGTRAGVPAIVVTRDGEGDGRPGSGGERSGRGGQGGQGAGGDIVGESSLMPANGVHSGNGKEDWRSGTPDMSGGYKHTQGFRQGGEEEDHSYGRLGQGTSNSHASASESEYSYRASGSGYGSTEGAESGSRTGDSDRLGLRPGYSDHGRPRTTSDSTSGSSLPSEGPRTLIPAYLQNSLGQNTQHRTYDDRKTTGNAKNTQPLPFPLSSARQGQNRSYLGHIQAPIALSHLGVGAPTMEDVEDAPPAYENVWASAREAGRLREERRRAGQQESRTQ
ncbi:hypothetical protein D9756_006271 [Leucocoprinus leucothites]|uniref:Uncharacterized protein n=1 Tax=Leucocoprinus leucothites TaxID=201217 RepID=A0A8H5FXM8_9AGAR|nr:hypothetical protein D9756_006271 [Leucoagaricus leucothites]